MLPIVRLQNLFYFHSGDREYSVTLEELSIFREFSSQKVGETDPVHDLGSMIYAIRSTNRFAPQIYSSSPSPHYIRTYSPLPQQLRPPLPRSQSASLAITNPPCNTDHTNIPLFSTYLSASFLRAGCGTRAADSYLDSI